MRTSPMNLSTALILLWIVALLPACSGNVATTRFANPQFDFAFVERVAVLPLENLTTDRQAAVRTNRILITELLASGAVDVLEPGEVNAVLDRMPPGATIPSTQQVVEIGAALEVQAIIVGSVTQSEVLRSGSVSTPVVTLDLHMLETETGTVVWAGTHTERASATGARLLGTGAEPISATTRKCVQALLGTLIQ